MLPASVRHPMKMRTPAIAINNSPTRRWMSVFMSMVSFPALPGDQPHKSGAPSDPEGSRTEQPDVRIGAHVPKRPAQKEKDQGYRMDRHGWRFQ